MPWMALQPRSGPRAAGFIRRAPCLALAFALALAAPVVRAAESPCGSAYTRITPLDPAAILSGAGRGGLSGLSHVWGGGNIRVLPAEDGGAVLRVLYPAGSINPGNDHAPVGGAGFQIGAGGNPAARCLRYRVRFPDGFDFVLGGKLPGLYGGDAPRGCRPAELSSGFSARLMWRAGGAGELYLYGPDRTVPCGGSIGRGSWTFPRGRWVTIAQEVVLNAPGRADGRVRLWIDNRPVLEAGGLVLRERETTRVEGLIFSTFFGGSDALWAPATDQSADFTGFELWDRPAAALPGP